MNKVPIKTDEEIRTLREAGKILAGIVIEIKNFVKIGVTTRDIDNLAEDLCDKNSVKPAFKGYQGFPATVCVGRNDVVVHGIPRENEILNDGDIISIDMGIIYKGLYSDHAITVGVGEISEEARKLMDATKEALYNGINFAVEGKTTGDIGHAIQSTVNSYGFSVVREMIGHGVGKDLHEAPEIPGYGEKGSGVLLQENMVLAIEAIINEGSPDISISRRDNWTTTTKDGRLAALFEHSVVVGKQKAQILTVL